MKRYIGFKMVEAEFVERIDGMSDGYRVVYPDGYHSCSPKDVFEEAYRENGKLSFEMALSQVKKGKGMRLTQWQHDVVIKAQFPDEHSKMTAPYLYVESRFGRVPWKETMIELFAENWEVVDLKAE